LFLENEFVQEEEYLYEQPVVNGSREQEIMNKLNKEGFFDNDEEVDDFDICRINHDKHHPITLSRRII
jgi:hypothetical protein